MGKKKIKQKAKKVAKKEVRKLLGRGGSKLPLIANPPTREHQMMAQNPYLCSLMDPYNCGAGTKIPDFGCMPTATLSVWDRRTLTVNANGVVGVFLQGLMPGLADGIGPAQPFSGGWILGTASTSSNLFTSFTTGGGYQNLLLGNNATGTTIDATYQDLRVVSAAICIEYTGTTLNDQGIFVGSSYPRESGALSWPGTTNLSLADFRNSIYSKEVAVNKHKGLTVVYKPSDASSFNFYRTGTRGYPINGTIANVNTNWSDGYGSMAVVGSGLTAGTTCNVIICINYEAHPEPASTTIVATSVTHNDPLALAHAQNVMNTQSAVYEGTSSVPQNPNYSKISTQTTADKKPSFLNKALSLVSGIPKVASEIGEGVEALAPLAALML